jgi:GAF domain-containing protein
MNRTDGRLGAEAERLEALRRYEILDSEPELAFDDLALLASHICATPMAAISLVAEDRQWFKARVGFAVTQTPRSISFCTHAIQQRGIFVVPDASKDERLRDNPQVTGDPHIRFYAGAPLIAREGHALGTLCVVDRRPRQLTPARRCSVRSKRSWSSDGVSSSFARRPRGSTGSPA